METSSLNDFWSKIVAILKDYPCKCRLRISRTDITTEWGSPIFEPSPSYVELMQFGPVAKRDIEWLEVDPVVMQHVGRLVPPKRKDFMNDLLQRFEDEGIKVILSDKYLRIIFNEESR